MDVLRYTAGLRSTLERAWVWRSVTYEVQYALANSVQWQHL